VSVSGSKIGGGAERAVVLFPDPMGATGGSMSRAMTMYKSMEGDAPMKLIAAHLIVTPEYVKRMTTTHPDAIIYAVRLDRGMSDPEVLKAPLGKRWDEERGLNEKQYIVPGAGGLGEILNNSYV
jgi:uracil phosphoribosyltransferase